MLQIFINGAGQLNWCACDLLQSKEKSKWTGASLWKGPSIRALTCCFIWERESTSLIHSLKYILKTVYKGDNLLPFHQLLFDDWHQESCSVVERPWHIP